MLENLRKNIEVTNNTENPDKNPSDVMKTSDFELHWLRLEEEHQLKISKRWLVSCIILKIFALILVSFSFVFAPLINFQDDLGHLTTLFYVSLPQDPT